MEKLNLLCITKYSYTLCLHLLLPLLHTFPFHYDINSNPVFVNEYEILMMVMGR